jgi:hypothetical protein
MDGQDWGELIAILHGNLIGLTLCTYVIARLLSETRLPRRKVLLAALFLGHIAANLLRMVVGDRDSSWSAVGFTISRLVGLPVLGVWLSRRVPRWRTKAGHREERFDEGPDASEPEAKVVEPAVGPSPPTRQPED